MVTNKDIVTIIGLGTSGRNIIVDLQRVQPQGELGTLITWQPEDELPVIPDSTQLVLIAGSATGQSGSHFAAVAHHAKTSTSANRDSKILFNFIAKAEQRRKRTVLGIGILPHYDRTLPDVIDEIRQETDTLILVNNQASPHIRNPFYNTSFSLSMKDVEPGNKYPFINRYIAVLLYALTQIVIAKPVLEWDSDSKRYLFHKNTLITAGVAVGKIPQEKGRPEITIEEAVERAKEDPIPFIPHSSSPSQENLFTALCTASSRHLHPHHLQGLLSHPSWNIFENPALAEIFLSCTLRFLS